MVLWLLSGAEGSCKIRRNFTRGTAMSEERKRPTHTAFAVRNFERKGKEDATWLKPVGGGVMLRLNEPKGRG